MTIYVNKRPEIVLAIVGRLMKDGGPTSWMVSSAQDLDKRLGLAFVKSASKFASFAKSLLNASATAGSADECSKPNLVGSRISLFATSAIIVSSPATSRSDTTAQGRLSG